MCNIVYSIYQLTEASFRIRKHVLLLYKLCVITDQASRDANNPSTRVQVHVLAQVLVPCTSTGTCRRFSHTGLSTCTVQCTSKTPLLHYSRSSLQVMQMTTATTAYQNKVSRLKSKANGCIHSTGRGSKAYM